MWLNDEFALKKLGSLHYFLGVEAFKDSAGFYLSQAKYVGDILKRLNMTDTKLCSSPAAPNSTLSKTEGEPMENPFQYMSVIGAL